MIAANELCFYQNILNTATFLFDGGTYSTTERNDLSKWILSHQNRHKDFLFYPTEKDRENGIRLFSGEKPRAKFLADNVVELETLRILALINPKAPEVREIFKQTNKRLFPLCFANKCFLGECAHASIAFLRYLTAYDAKFYSSRAANTLDTLRKKRSGDGKWNGFPFYFTLLWLTELPETLASDELTYASIYCLKLFTRKIQPDDRTGWIRKKIMQRALARAAESPTSGLPARQSQKSLIQIGF